jgi:streptomycin 6-kinase
LAIVPLGPRLAFGGLSAAWHIADGEPADLDLAVARLAAAAL